MATSPMRSLDPESATSLIRSSDVPVWIEVGAEWCDPCKKMKPHLRKLAAEFDGHIVIADVDGDEHKDLSTQWEVEVFPSLLLFRGGDIAARHDGFEGYASLRAMIGAAVPDAADGPAEAAYVAAVDRAEQTWTASVAETDKAADALWGPAMQAVEAFAAEQQALVEAGSLSPDEMGARVNAERQKRMEEIRPTVEAALAVREKALAAYAAAVDEAASAFMAADPGVATAAAGGQSPLKFCKPGDPFCKPD